MASKDVETQFAMMLLGRAGLIFFVDLRTFIRRRGRVVVEKDPDRAASNRDCSFYMMVLKVID